MTSGNGLGRITQRTSWASWCTIVCTVKHLVTSLITSLQPPKSLLVFVCALCSSLSTQHLRLSSFFDCWPDGLEFVDPAHSFDSFRQFLKTVLFSFYWLTSALEVFLKRYVLYKSTFYLLTVEEASRGQNSWVYCMHEWWSAVVNPQNTINQ